jgi:hypothetical protein
VKGVVLLVLAVCCAAALYANLSKSGWEIKSAT